MDITIILTVISICFLAIMGSHVYEHKDIYEKLEEIEKKIEELKRTNSNS